MSRQFNISEIVFLLKESRTVSKVEIKTIDAIKGKGVYKIRCNLIPSKYKLEIRFVQTGGPDFIFLSTLL